MTRKVPPTNNVPPLHERFRDAGFTPVFHRLIHHLHHHAYFYVAMLLGAIVYATLPLFWRNAVSLRPTTSGDVFFTAYLCAMAFFGRGSSASRLRAHVRQVDETAPFIFFLTAIAVSFGLVTIFTLLHDHALPLTVRIGTGISSVVLAWCALHVAAAFHYAHLFYGRTPAGRVAGSKSHQTECPDAGGLQFPGTETPALWDFLYFSFVVGMTAQVSDVQVTQARMRRFVLLHGIASFFFNAIILALAVNVAAGLSA